MSELDALDESAITWPDGTLVTIPGIDEWSEHARSAVTPRLVEDTIVRGPDWVMNELDLVSHLAGQMVVVVKNAGAVKRARAAVLRRARAEARGRHASVRGAAQTALVDLDVEEQQAAYDEAVIAEDYARHIADLVADRKSTVQSMGRQVEILFRDQARGL